MTSWVFVLLLLFLRQLCDGCSIRSALISLRGGAAFLNEETEQGDSKMDTPASDSAYTVFNARKLEVRDAPAKLEGIYTQTKWGMNGRSHYEKNVNPSGHKVHLYWSGNQWVFHYDLDVSQNFDNLLAYSKVNIADPIQSSKWHVRKGKSYEASTLQITIPSSSNTPRNQANYNIAKNTIEMFGVPKILVPLYFSFLMDAIAVGLAMPLLPFYIMELGADALQLSMVISCNYVAQSFGCIVMGKISDRNGRRPVLLCCLAASALSYFCVSRSKTLLQVALARIIVGSFGGLTPVMQSCVADVSSQEDRPKYLGRIMATFGIGFVIGPALSAAVPGFTTREKIRLSAILPVIGFLFSLAFFKETKDLDGSSRDKRASELEKNLSVGLISVAQNPATISTPVLLLVINGFLLMYAFGTETIYAMFMKDSFGYGERILSALFAFCGVFIGIFQSFLIKPLINSIGKHATLALGSTLLVIGMIGIALVRQEVAHFGLFAAHIIGYSIADTALVSLISRYSSPQSQGLDLALNQAGQSLARVLSPLIAGLLYERSKRLSHLPIGALPFLAAAVLPAVGVIIPSLLLLRSRASKLKR